MMRDGGGLAVQREKQLLFFLFDSKLVMQS